LDKGKNELKIKRVIRSNQFNGLNLLIKKLIFHVILFIIKFFGYF